MALSRWALATGDGAFHRPKVHRRRLVGAAVLQGLRRVHGALRPVFVAAGEVAGLLFGLPFLLPHAIERCSIEHDLDGVVPAQIVVLGEDGARLVFFKPLGISDRRRPLRRTPASISSNLSRSCSLRWKAR